MNCKLCGFTLPEGAAVCPHCGTRVEPSAEMFGSIDNNKPPVMPLSEEISWNTYDFPKPRQMRDIEFNWSTSGMLSGDASEGYVKTEPVIAQVPVQPMPQVPPVQMPQQPAHLQPAAQSGGTVWQMPVMQSAPDTPLWYTQPVNIAPEAAQQPSQPQQPAPQVTSWTMQPQAFTASGYMQTTPAWTGTMPPMPPAYNPYNPAFTQPPVQPQASAPQPAAEPAPAQTSAPAAEPAAAPAPEAPAYAAPSAPETPAEPLAAAVPAPEAPLSGTGPERFKTFYAKNDDFQKLLDEQYARMKELNGGQYTPAPAQTRYVPATSVQAEDLSEFEKMLFEGTTSATAEMPVLTEDIINAEEVRRNEKPAESRPLENLPIAEVTTAIGSEAFLKRTIELKVKELKAQEEADGINRSRRRQKLEEMKRARAEYFGTNPVNPEDFKTTVKADNPPKTVAPEVPSPAEVQPAAAAAEEAQPEAVVPQTGNQAAEAPQVAPAAEKPQEPAAPQPSKTETKRDDTYDDDEKKFHPILSFIIICIIVAALFEAAVLGLNKFMPDSTATDVANYAQETIVDYCGKGVDKVRGLVNKVLKKEEPQQAESSEVPGLDFSALVTENNRNIESISFDTGLNLSSGAYSSKVDGIKDMEVCTDDAVLTEVYGTLISYNSSWIDYVNDGSQDCLDYLKAEGVAYRNALNFSSNGDLKENFTKLVLGEVRLSGDSAYVLAKESIEVKVGSQSSNPQYQWVYKMDKVGERYKIVEYTELN